jgi:hypothetical protein
LISIEEIENHEHNGRKFGIHEYISRQMCPFCKNYFSLDSLIQGICRTCDLASGPRRSPEPSPLAERLDRNLRFAYISNPGIETIEDYLTQWLIKFDVEDRGLLTWLLTANLLTKHGKYGAPVWHTPTFAELELDRKIANLPRDGDDISQIMILREWYEAWKEATLNKPPIQFDGDEAQTAEEVESQHRSNRVYVDNLEAIWGFVGGSLKPFITLSNDFNLTPSRVKQIVARSWGETHYGRRETRQINEVRRQLMWVARVIDVFELDTQKYWPTLELYESLNSYLGDLPDFERIHLHAMILTEMSIQEISRETGLQMSSLQSTVDEFMEVLESSNLR